MKTILKKLFTWKEKDIFNKCLRIDEFSVRHLEEPLIFVLITFDIFDEVVFFVSFVYCFSMIFFGILFEILSMKFFRYFVWKISQPKVVKVGQLMSENGSFPSKQTRHTFLIKLKKKFDRHNFKKNISRVSNPLTSGFRRIKRHQAEKIRSAQNINSRAKKWNRLIISTAKNKRWTIKHTDWFLS